MLGIPIGPSFRPMVPLCLLRGRRRAPRSRATRSARGEDADWKERMRTMKTRAMNAKAGKAAVLLPACGCLLLAGCATIISGRSQEMTINTAPEGAHCDIVRVGKGELVARVVTPQTITIRKSKHDLRITCRKAGYQTTTHLVKSEIADATWGNIVLGGAVGWAIDSAGGADNKYARYVNISLPPITEKTGATNPSSRDGTSRRSRESRADSAAADGGGVRRD